MHYLANELFGEGRRALNRYATAAALALSAYSCGGGKCMTGPDCRPNTPPEITSAALPNPAYFDAPSPLTLQGRDADGNPVTYNVAWTVNSIPRPELSGQMVAPAGTAQPGDTLSVRVRGYDGRDSSNVATASAVVQDPYRTITRSFVNYRDNSGVQGLRAVLTLSPTDSVVDTTDASGRADFRYDTRRTVTGPRLDMRSNVWYNFSRPENLALQNDTLQMIDRFVEPGTNDDLLDRYKQMKSIATTGGLKKGWLNTAWPLRIFADRAAEPTAGIADLIMQAYGDWESATGVDLVTEVSGVQNADVIISYENRPDYMVSYLSSSDNSRIIQATIHIPVTAPANQAFREIMREEAGHTFGLFGEDPVSSHVMGAGNQISPLEVREIWLERFLRNLTVISYYSRN